MSRGQLPVDAMQGPFLGRFVETAKELTEASGRLFLLYLLSYLDGSQDSSLANEPTPLYTVICVHVFLARSSKVLFSELGLCKAFYYTGSCAPYCWVLVTPCLSW